MRGELHSQPDLPSLAGLTLRPPRGVPPYRLRSDGTIVTAADRHQRQVWDADQRSACSVRVEAHFHIRPPTRGACVGNAPGRPVDAHAARTRGAARERPEAASRRADVAAGGATSLLTLKSQQVRTDDD